MTPAEREELARAVIDLVAAADAVEASGVLRVLGGRLTDTLRVMAWRVKRLEVAAALREGTTMDSRPCCTQWETCRAPCTPRADHFAAALREPVGEAQPVNLNAVSVAADMLRDVAADLDRAVRVSQAGVAGSVPQSGGSTPGQSQPASAEPCASCSEQLVTIADLRAENRILRGLVQTNPEWKCPHGMDVPSIGFCPSGFPGCACADDQVAVLCEDEARIVSTLRTRAERAEAEVAWMRPIVDDAVARRLSAKGKP